MAEEGVFLRTVLRPEVDERLKEFAKTFSTGRGHWDIGVAIQVLLDYYEDNHNSESLHQKMDLILNNMMQPPEEQVVEEETGIEMLGGERLK